MFKVTAADIDAYFGFDPSREDELRAVDAMIRRSAPAWDRWFVSGTPQGEPGMKMSMIGYGHFTYRTRSSRKPIEWPIIGLALQKNHLSLYLAAKLDGVSFAAGWAGRLGRVSVSKTGAIRFTRVADIDADAFSQMLRAVDTDLAEMRADLAYARLSPQDPQTGSTT